MFIVALMLALILSAFNVAPTFADEATPPAETQGEVQDIESTTPEEEAATPPADEETDSASESESPTVAEVIESLPEDTTLVVVDENGEALPLASEEAAEVIEGADPQWCPVGVTPGSSTCSGSFTYFTGAGGLIEWLLANQAAVAKAGVIWVESAYDASLELDAEIVLDGGDFAAPGASMDDFALTINGGWAGGTSKTLNPNAPSEFDLPFSIINWTGTITINNIVIDSATTGNYALEVGTAGNITLNNVDVQNATTTSGGANLDNGSGAGNVIVNDSTFNNNSGRGVEITSNGTVTLKNVTANGNFNDGASIDNTSATTPKAVTLNGTNHFSYNGAGGLEIFTKGVITINNVTAMGNAEGHGAFLENCEFDYVNLDCNYGVANGVTIKGTNNFSDNGWDGLRVWSGGVITVSNITANGNGTSATRPAASPDPDNFNATGKGAFLFNYGAATPKNIAISGTNTFNNNASTGLHADSFGLVTVSNITASFNDCDTENNFEETTEYCAGAYIYGEGGVTQTGYGRFEGNDESGLLVYAPFKGTVTLNNLYVDNNGSTGVYVDGVGYSPIPINVTINGINTFTNNGGAGLVIDTDGTVTLNNLNASYNGEHGVFVYNAYLTKSITLKGASAFNFNGFGGSTGSGLILISYGAITTNGITASNNFESGAILDNCVSGTCDAPTAQKIIMNGNNSFDDNGGDGLYVVSRGAITINNLTATYNFGKGAYVNNLWANAVGALTIKGFANTSYNSGNGLEIYSNGAITLANVTANVNDDGTGQGYGVSIDNYGYLAPANVTITGTNNFNLNGDTGLYIQSMGAITLYNLTANYNGDASGDNGVRIINDVGGLLVRPVTILGTNMFNGNFGTGLEVQSLGAIKVNNVMANDNFEGGANLNNEASAISSQPITITGYGIFNNNGTYTGLNIQSKGNVMLANITANSNGAGVYIDTNNDFTDTGLANVTISGVNTFNNNDLHGLQIYGDGVIALSNLTANGNSEKGVWVDNLAYANLGATGIKNVAINGVNMFNANGSDGLYVQSKGTVSLTRITANLNNDPDVGETANGVFIQTDGAINLTCGSMYSNQGAGYDLTAGSGKVVTIKGVFTYGNPLVDFSGPTTVQTRACPLP